MENTNTTPTLGYVQLDTGVPSTPRSEEVYPVTPLHRVMIATKEEMDSAKIPLENRDYCAHILIKHMACRDKVWPLTYKCAHEKHEYLNCQYDDYVLRMKEHERERRLLERAKRKAAKAALEQLEEE
ncbi:NADH dehydrogenase [ubiquinone] 1 beta subcomplex subunit 7 isoform X2 [Palaemon carinicauda]|uniref:NADH dehydrogenase [ubiquinone] 1 beta subcomplex subunit 7 isoform X2 n=1 Tax=Palaemon carinicauda TaxID=392227 RepID=UPI0035B681F9